mgnify:CR=1 FL=1
MEVNTLFPGRPNYTGPTQGLFGLIHHNVLYEYSNNIIERVEYIKVNKPSNEAATRLWCLVYIDPIGQEWSKADAEWIRARAEWNKAYAEWNKADAEWNKARGERSKARAEWSRADAEWSRHTPAILAHILTIIPDLPWNGQELVFEAQDVSDGNL